MRQAVIDLASQPIKNLCANPAATSAAGYVGTPNITYTSLVAGGAPNGGDSVKFRVNAATAAQAVFVGYGNLIDDLPANPSTTYHCSIWVKTDRARTMTCNAVPWISSGSYTGGEVFGPTVSVLAGVWTRLEAVITTRTDTARLQIRARERGTTVDGVVGEFIEIAMPMAVEGSVLYSYADGNTPGWRWTGTANSSPSSGYPYTLESIAGQPMADLIGEDTIAPISGDPLSPFTIYGVYDAGAPWGEWTTLATVIGNPTVVANADAGWLSHGALSYGRRNGGSLTQAHSRAAFVNSGNNYAAISAVDGTFPAWTQGRHIVSGQLPRLNPGENTALTWLRDDTSTGLHVGGGMPNGDGINRAWFRARAGTTSTESPTPTTNASNVRWLYYPADHDLATRQKIMAWLARQYGGAIPAGY